MSTTTYRPLEVLFLTNFSNACFRAIPALAQMADDLDVRLTILHASDGASRSGPPAETKLRNFFPEADTYRSSRRLLVSEDPVDAVARLKRRDHVDLIVAPAGDPLGLPSVGRSSLRARLLAETATPVWTMGPETAPPRTRRHARSVGCWLDLESRDKSHLRAACEYAWAVDATLHVFHVVPDVDDALIMVPLESNRPLNASSATEAIRALTVGMPLTPQILVSSGHEERALKGFVKRTEADVMFVSRARAIQTRWFGSRVSSIVDTCGCPVISVDASGTQVAWSRSRSAWRPLKRAVPGTMNGIGSLDEVGVLG